MTTPTPRTDAIRSITDGGNDDLVRHYEQLARQLERDLAAALERIAQLELLNTAECKHSQLMREELAARDAELAAMKQRAEAAERKAEEAARDAEALHMIRGWLNNGATIKAHSVPCIVFKDDGSVDGQLDISYPAAIAAKGEA